MIIWSLLLQGGAQLQATATVIARPNSDITTTGWTASTGTVLYEMIDEVTPSDADYIISPGLASSPGPAIFGLNSSLSSGSYTVRVRARYNNGAAGYLQAFLLDSSNNVVGTGAQQALTSAYATYDIAITVVGVAVRIKLEVSS